MYLLLIGIVVLVTALLPFIIERFMQRWPIVKTYPAPKWLPAAAAILFFVAFYLPNIHISKETTTFQQHFVGGGMYTAFLYVYAKRLFGWKFHWLLAVLLLYAWTSAFGIANELLEFALTKLGLANIGTGDTDWDLLANTLGSCVGYGLLLLARVEKL